MRAIHVLAWCAVGTVAVGACGGRTMGGDDGGTGGTSATLSMSPLFANGSAGVQMAGNHLMQELVMMMLRIMVRAPLLMVSRLVPLLSICSVIDAAAPLPMPTVTHQRISKRLLLLLDAWLEARGGVIYYSPLRLRVSETRFREPGLLAFLDAADARNADDYWRGADLVVEIISPGNADHDLVTKRLEYAEARIPEYWIVDPTTRTLERYLLASSGALELADHLEGDARFAPDTFPGLEIELVQLWPVASR